MDNKNIIIAVLIALIIAGIIVLGFTMFHNGNDENIVVNNTTAVNDTNDTVNTTSTNNNQSSSQRSSSSGGWDEVQDLSEFYDDGKRHTVTIHHDGHGGISWTDDLGYHTGREGDIQSW